MDYSHYINAVDTDLRCFESYQNLHVFLGEDMVANEGINIKQLTNDFLNAVKRFFKDLWVSIKNYWSKFFGKDGRLMNAKAVNLIQRQTNQWSRNIVTVTDPLLRATEEDEIRGVITRASDVYNEMEEESKTLLHRVNTEVINYPKIKDYRYYKKNEIDSFETIVSYIEDTSIKLSNKASNFKDEGKRNSSFVYFQKIVMYMIQACGEMTKAIMESIARATYVNKEKNSKVEFDKPFEVEVEFE